MPSGFRKTAAARGGGRTLECAREATAPRRLWSVLARAERGCCARPQPILKAVSRCRLPPQSKGKRGCARFYRPFGTCFAPVPDTQR